MSDSDIINASFEITDNESINTEFVVDNSEEQLSASFTIASDTHSSTFVYEQGIASDTWEITHNLGRKPSVTVVDSADNIIYPAVQYINENKLVVQMNGATTGKAYLN